jgi:membrane protease YdiL (CAAX protease family)
MRLSRFPLLWFFVLAYVLSGVGQLVHFFVVRRIMAGVPGGTPIDATPISTWLPYAFYITNAGPSLVGLLMTLFLYGFPGVRRLILQLAPWSVGREWPVLLVCLLLPLGVIVLPLTILAALGASVPPPSWQLSEYLYGATIGGGFLGPGLCEEIGWRGFALPHLQRRYSALASSLIIGLAWAFWHWPNFVIPSDSLQWWHVLAFIPLTMAISVLFTWVYNSTGGNLFAVVVLHGAIYTALAVCPSPDKAVAAREDVIFLLLFAVIAVGLVWRYGTANLSLRDRVVAHPPNTCVNRSGESGGI